MQGIEDGLIAAAPTEEDLSLLSTDELSERGIIRLPTSLKAALDRLEANKTVCGWFPERFVQVYRAHKAAEMAHVADMQTEARCAEYEQTY